ncbi:MAG: HAD-IA family hydrolase [Treponema sp.]|jgi:putative hydrolase of the HAD superfamily|nr:HAD-IA family hydrolase [Treponema sp.]
MPLYRAVIFDLFYTLINPLDSACMRNNEYEVLGMKREDFESRNSAQYERWAGGSIRDPVEILRQILKGLDYPEPFIRAATGARIERVRRGLFDVAKKNLALLETLRQDGLKIALVSNADVIDTKYWKSSPLASCFDVAVFSWEVGFLKPDPRIYALVLERLNLKSGDCLYVGDGGHGELRGAKEAGISTVLTTEYIQNLWPEKIPALKAWADHVIDDMDGLQAALQIGQNIPVFQDNSQIA